MVAMAVAAKGQMRRVAPAIYVRSGSFWVSVHVDGAKVWHGPKCIGCTHEPIRDLPSAKRVKRVLEAEKVLPSVIVMDAESVGEWWGRWLDVFPRRLSTMAHYRERTQAFVRAHAETPLNAVSKEQAMVWASQHSSSVKELRTMFADARRIELIQVNPFAGVQVAKGRGRRDLVAPTVREIDALALKAGEVWGEWGRTVYGPMIVFAAFTGLRPGELHALRWEDIGQGVSVSKSVSKDGTVGATKSGRGRVVPLLPRAREALRGVPRGDGEVFRTARGRRFTARTSSYYWRELGARFDPYALRHAFGSMLAAQGVSPYDIAEAMGHADGGKLAMDTYIHTTAEGARQRIMGAFGA